MTNEEAIRLVVMAIEQEGGSTTEARLERMLVDGWMSQERYQMAIESAKERGLITATRYEGLALRYELARTTNTGAA